jgi:tetratricopeptide (TPR) repeat protein
MENSENYHQDLLAATVAVARTIDVDDERSEITEAIAIEYALRADFDRAADLMETVQDPYSHDKGIGSLAVLVADAGDTEFADQLLNSIEDQSLLTTALELVAVSHAKRGDFDAALQLSDELADTAETWRAIAEIYAAKGLNEKALELARSIEAPLPRTFTLVELALQAKDQGFPVSAQELIVEAAEAAGTIEFAEDQVEALITIASVYEKLDAPDAAYDRLCEAIRVCDEIESTSGIITATSVRDQELAIIAAALANLKFFEKAEEVLETIEDPFRFALGSGQVAVAYRKNQLQAEANELLAQAVEIAKDEDVVSEQAVVMQQEVFANLAYMYATNGQIEKSLEVVELVHRVGLKNDWLTEIGRVAVRLGFDPSIVSESYTEESSKASFWVVISDEYAHLDRGNEADDALNRAIQSAEKSDERPYEQALAFSEIATRLHIRDRLEQSRQLVQRTLSMIPKIASRTRKALVLLALARKNRKVGHELNESESAQLHEILSGLDL